MFVKEINEVKEHLNYLKANHFIQEWELPYENLLTRLNAAIFFLTPADEDEKHLSDLWNNLGKFPEFSYRANDEKKLSGLKYRVTFSKDEKEKNAKRIVEQATENG